MLQLLQLVVMILLRTVACADDFTYEDLTKLIQTQGLTSIEAVLPQLPVEMRSNYTLVGGSRSLQCSSADQPRAILFGSNGKLTCAFNGDPSECGYDSLECIEFLDADRKFDFRQIQFPTAANSLKTVQFSKSNRTVDGKVSCSVCHSVDPRPNWDNYNFWPGAYGSQEDKVDAEQEDYLRFVDIRYDHPRYQWLLQDSYTFAPYRDVYLDVDVAHRPNFRFTEITGRLNALRAARILEEKLPAWERWAYVVAALNCDLSQEQQAVLKKDGLDPDKDLQMAKIFKDVGLESYEWSTQISDDPHSFPDRPWEHQSGFSMFSESVAMALIEEKAKAGDALLAGGIDKILNYYSKTYFGYDLDFNQTLNAIVPSTDFFGSGHADNLSYLCPESINLLTAEVAALRVGLR